MTTSRLLLAVALALPLSSPAFAADGEWTTVASACMPDESAIASYVNDGAASYIANGITGDIILRCNVTSPAEFVIDGTPDWNTLDITYNDPDGPGTDRAVIVSLRRVHEITGNSSTIMSFSSNIEAAGQQLISPAFMHTFNFEDYAYYIQITLRRVLLDGNGDGVPDSSPRIQRLRLWTDTPA